MGMLASWIGRYDGFTAALGQPIAEFSGVVGPVRDEASWRWHASQQGGGADKIVGLARCHREGDGTTNVISQGMNFGRPSAARSADGMFEVPPFAPAAERCALTWVLSTAAVTTPLEPLRA